MLSRLQLIVSTSCILLYYRCGLYSQILSAPDNNYLAFLLFLHVGQPRTCENLHKAINRGDLQAIKTILDDKYKILFSGA